MHAHLYPPASSLPRRLCSPPSLPPLCAASSPLPVLPRPPPILHSSPCALTLPAALPARLSAGCGAMSLSFCHINFIPEKWGGGGGDVKISPDAS